MKIGIYDYPYPVEVDEKKFYNKQIRVVARSWSDGNLKIFASKEVRDDRFLLMIEARKDRSLYIIELEYKIKPVFGVNALHDIYITLYLSLLNLIVSCKLGGLTIKPEPYFIHLSSIEQNLLNKGFRNTILDIYDQASSIAVKCDEFSFYPAQLIPEKYRDPESPEHAKYFRHTINSYKITLSMYIGGLGEQK